MVFQSDPMDFTSWYNPLQAYTVKHVLYPQLTATGGDRNFFTYAKGGQEKNGDRPSQVDGPLPVKNDSSLSKLHHFKPPWHVLLLLNYLIKFSADQTIFPVAIP